MLHDDVFQRERQAGRDDKTTTLFRNQSTGPLAIDDAGQPTSVGGWGTRNCHVVDIDHVVVIALFGFVFRAVKRVTAGRNDWHETARTGTGVVTTVVVVRGVFTRGVHAAFEHTFRGTLDVWDVTIHFTTLLGPQGDFRAPLARWVVVAAVGATVQLHNIARACLSQTGTDGQPRVLFRATTLFVVPVW